MEPLDMGDDLRGKTVLFAADGRRLQDAGVASNR